MLQTKTEPDTSGTAGTLDVMAMLGASFPHTAQLMLRDHTRSGENTRVGTGHRRRGWLCLYRARGLLREKSRFFKSARAQGCPVNGPASGARDLEGVAAGEDATGQLCARGGVMTLWGHWTWGPGTRRSGQQGPLVNRTPSSIT